MTGLDIWRNQQIDRLRRDMDLMFDRICGEFGLSLFLRPGKVGPSMDLRETAESLILTAEIPGLDPEDLDISIMEDQLILKGSMQQELVKGQDDYHRTEKRSVSFTRAVRLPSRIRLEAVQAFYKDGILKVVMPKTRQEAVRKLKIERA